MVKKNKRLAVAERLFEELPPNVRSPEVYRAIATAAKVKAKIIDDHLALVEKMSAKFAKPRRRRSRSSEPSGFGGF